MTGAEFERGFRVATGLPPAPIEQRPGDWFWIEWRFPAPSGEVLWVYDAELCSRVWQAQTLADSLADHLEALTGLRRFPDGTDNGDRIADRPTRVGNVIRLIPKPTDLAVPVVSGPLPPDPYILVVANAHGWIVWLCPRYSGGFVIRASDWRPIYQGESKADALTVAAHVAAELGDVDIVDSSITGDAA